MDFTIPNIKQIKDRISDYNKQAIDLLTIQKFQESFSLLKKAEKLLNHIDSQDRLQAITYNNLGCFYKSVQKLQPALDMFIKSLALNNFDKSLQAGTHLNVCSILSLLGSHKKALDHGLTAFKMLQKIQESDPSCTSSLLFAAFITGKEYEQLSQMKQAESLYKFAEQIGEEFGIDGFQEKIADALEGLTRKKINGSKTRFSSVSRRAELPLIKTNQSDYSKNFLMVEEKRKFSPRALRTYPPILDIPYSRQIPKTSDSPTHKKAKTNLSEIKRELMEYEEKFRRLTGTGKRNLKIRSAKISQVSKAPVKPPHYFQDPIKPSHSFQDPIKPVYYFQDSGKQIYNFQASGKPQFNFQDSAKKPISPSNMNLSKAAVIIQKNWRAYKARVNCRQKRRKVAQQKAREAIEELEMLKIEAKNDKMFVVNEESWRPKTYSPLKVQKSEKMYKTLGKFPKNGFSLHEKLSIIKIQGFGRMAIQRGRFRKIKKSALVIQRNVKRFQCVKLFQKIISAILFIQYQWRKVKKQRLQGAKI